MGLPAEGMASFYRNSRSDVLRYFGKFHKGKVKIINLCDDKFIDTSKTWYPIDKNLLTSASSNFAVTSVPVAYYPMMDHNPGSLKMLFHLCLDALLFLCQDPENMTSIHCKAGKGRTGMVIACYMVFMEGVPDADKAVEQFNFRRTNDMRGGLKIPSQIRYVHYFHHFLKQTFNRPFKRILGAYIRNPLMFDQFLNPSQLLKLTSISLGPFASDPDAAKGTKLDVKVLNFTDSNVLESAILDSATRLAKKKGGKHFTPAHFATTTVHDPNTGLFYLLLTFNSLVLLTDDFCIRVKSLQTPHQIEPFKFRFWLHANFVKPDHRPLTEVIPVNLFDIRIGLQELTLSEAEIKRGASVVKAADKKVERQHDDASAVGPSGCPLVTQLASGFKSMSFCYFQSLAKEGLWLANSPADGQEDTTQMEEEKEPNENVDSDSDGPETATARTVHESKGSALKRRKAPVVNPRVAFESHPVAMAASSK